MVGDLGRGGDDGSTSGDVGNSELGEPEGSVNVGLHGSVL